MQKWYSLIVECVLMWSTLYSVWLIMLFLIFWPYIRVFIPKESMLQFPAYNMSCKKFVLIIRILYKNFPFKPSVSLHVRKPKFVASCIPWSMHQLDPSHLADILYEVPTACDH